MSETRLIYIIGYLFTHGGEIVISEANRKHKSYYTNEWKYSWECYVQKGPERVFEVTQNELEWLLRDNIIEPTGGSDDPDYYFATRTHVMTTAAENRLRRILASMREKKHTAHAE